ncbi:MAG: hypothetical protein L6Q37_06240 [Bdellovibrionaceae bacterium]|nr:hypothetical protein [Pseudobdellovibrionaceae bacterium]NUM60284.1 hypothetical protein [Pseudobdellovibrionaceae bacterium]
MKLYNLLFFLIFFNFIFSNLAFAQEVFDTRLIPPSTEIDLLKKKEDVSYISQLISAPTDIKGQNYSTPISPDQLISNYCVTTGSTVFFKESTLNNMTSSVWTQLKFPSEKWRSSVFVSYLKSFQKSFLDKNLPNAYYSINHNILLEDLKSTSDYEITNTINQSVKILKQNYEISGIYLSRFNHLIEIDKNSKNDYLSKFSGFLVGNYLCSELVFSEEDKSSCSKALSWIISSSTPTEKQIIFHRLWKKLLNEPRIIEVYTKLAIKILSRIQKKDTNTAFWFDDIYSSFKSIGYPNDVSDQMTWDTIVLLTSGGGNTYRKLAALGVGNIYLEHLLFILSNGPLVLDAIAQQQNIPNLYSYPKELNISCDTGKPYTFWSSAYFSKELKKASYSSIQAISATYSVQKIYQFGFNDGGRDSSLPFKVDQFDNYNNRIRQDLVMASIGSYYGATSNLNLSKQEFENIFRNLFSQSNSIPLNPSEETVSIKNPIAAFQKYQKWSKLFAPNSSISLMKEKIN